MWDGVGWGPGDWLTMTVMMLIVWLPIILIGYLLVRAATGTRTSDRDARPSAEDEARRAYARGELTREQFQQIIQDLREERP